MSKYSISIFVCCLALVCRGQDITDTSEPRDSIESKNAFGLRLGVDLSRQARPLWDDQYSGIEFVGDFRLTEQWWLAAEVGNEERTREETIEQSVLYTYTTSGSYLKIGGDYNTYGNWYGMQNQIHIGGRYAFSTLSQTLDNYRLFNSNRLFSPDEFAVGSTEGITYENLNASWLEVVMGVKAELFANIYIGISARLAHLITTKEPDNFRNLWIPGFNKVTENAKWGVGYNYTISYFLPLYKKAKKPRPEPKTVEE
ncbi:MAG: DUF6048 family protein [Bacteroidota bacterium]